MSAVLASARVTTDDRFALTLCLALIVHAMLILGVSFAPEPATDAPFEALEIILVPERSARAPDEADLLAQANLVGGGDEPDSAPPAAPVRAPLPAQTADIAATPAPPVTAQPTPAPEAQPAPAAEASPAPVRPWPNRGTAQRPRILPPDQRRKRRRGDARNNPQNGPGAGTGSQHPPADRAHATRSFTGELNRSPAAARFARQASTPNTSRQHREHRYAATWKPGGQGGAGRQPELRAGAPP